MYRKPILEIIHLYMNKATECIKVIANFMQNMEPLETGEKEYTKYSIPSY